jgi:hypothetical protein
MIKLDGSDLRKILDLLGAPAEPTPESTEQVAEIETWVGRPLPEETRQFLLTPVALTHPDATHPHVTADFLSGLPDVDAFIDSFANAYQGRFNATVHFLGLYPLGVQLQYGDFLYAMALLEPHTDFRFGGVMYYDEREVGSWGATLSQFLMHAIESFWKQCSSVAGDAGDGHEIVPGALRDCFALDYDWRNRPPETEALPDALVRNWEQHWRDRAGQTPRWWIVNFLNGDFGPHALEQLPALEQWEAERELVAKTHHDAMYWLLAHALLDNQEELRECAALVEQNASRLAKAMAAAVVQPGFADRWAQTRQKVFQMTREAFDSR